MSDRVNESYFKEHCGIFEKDVTFYNAKEEPFSIYGLYQPTLEEEFKRIPDEIAHATSEGVSKLYKNTAGGRICFITNSEYLAIKVEMPYIAQRSIMSLLGSAGFDVYVRRGDSELYHGSFRPPIDMTDGFESSLHFGDNNWKEVAIYFPLYNDVSNLFIGISNKAKLQKHSEYAIKSPVIYYGSSITQGACASRPGMSYEAIISRKLNRDFINLGFAGNARGEDTIVNYMASLPCSAFVCDYDHNAPTPAHLQNTHEKLYLAIRSAHKTEPILLVSRPTPSYYNQDHISRRNIVFSTYQHGIANGDKNLYFVDGFSLFGTDISEDCYADGIHPNDLGFYRMANRIGKVLEVALSNPQK